SSHLIDDGEGNRVRHRHETWNRHRRSPQVSLEILHPFASIFQTAPCSNQDCSVYSSARKHSKPPVSNKEKPRERRLGYGVGIGNGNLEAAFRSKKRQV